MTLAFYLLFSWFMVTARTRRQVIALSLAGTLTAVLIAPPRVQAAGSLIAAIQTVLKVINGVIKTGLNSINTARTAISNFYQTATWPVNLINQARAQVTQMTTQYRTSMRNIFKIDLGSATLPNPKALENVMRNRQTGDFASLTSAYRNTYGAVPAPTYASPIDRAMIDMDDALALDNLKTVKATDQADDLTLQAADRLETAASQAAPGSAPFLTAIAVVATIESQAMTQKMLAAELRQEAAQLAHANALHKRRATMTGQISGEILNLLRRK